MKNPWAIGDKCKEPLFATVCKLLYCDRTNLEVILYNLLVQVHEVDPNIANQVKPELALLNGDGDRINKNIDFVRRKDYVGEDFNPVRGGWWSSFAEDIRRLTRVDRISDDTPLAERLPLDPLFISELAAKYRRVFLINIEKFMRVASKDMK